MLKGKAEDALELLPARAARKENRHDQRVRDTDLRAVVETLSNEARREQERAGESRREQERAGEQRTQ